MHGVAEGKYPSFVVCPPRVIISPYSYYFLAIVIQDYKPSSSVAILGVTVKLDIKVGSFDKTGTSGEVNRPLQGSFSGLCVFQKVI